MKNPLSLNKLKKQDKPSKQQQADACASVHDYFAEGTLLADILVYPKNFMKVAYKIQVDDFHLKAHKLIYQAIHTLVHSGRDIDNTQVLNEIYKMDPDNLSGAIAVMGDIISQAHNVTHIEAHADIVKKLSQLRHLQAHYQEQLARCINPQEDPNELIQSSIDFQYALIQDFHKKGITHVNETAQELVKVLKDEKQGIFKERGLQVGFKAFDYSTGGLIAGDFVVIAAMTGAGKSAFSMNMVTNMAAQGKRILVFSLEMTMENLVDRMVFSNARVSRDRRKQRELTDDEYDQAISSGHTVADLPVWIDTTAPLTLTELLIKIQQAKMQHQIDCVVLDYIQLVSNNKGGATRDERMGEVSRTLKMIAQNVELPIIVLAQVNRKYTERDGMEGKKPSLGDVRESGSIESDADIVTFLYRPEIFKIHEINGVSTRNRAIGIMAKVRNGTAGEFDLRFNKEYTLFEDLQPSEQSICTQPIHTGEEGIINNVSTGFSSDMNNGSFTEMDPNGF